MFPYKLIGMSELPPYCISLVTVIVLATYLQNVKAQQAYCWDPCQLECVQNGPRLCPEESILTYYDCCPDGCCQYIKWPNLLFLMFIILLLLTGCCCCAFFLLTDSRQRMFLKQQQREAIEHNRHREQNVTPGAKSEKSGTGFKHKKHSTIV